MAVGDGAKRRVKCGARDGDDMIAVQLHGGGFAEGAGFALKCDANFFDLQLSAPR